MSGLQRDAIDRHVARMRLVTTAALAIVAVAAVIGFALPRSRSALLPPGGVTVVALAVALWVAFTSERDARGRLDRVKRAFAVHGDHRRLLNGHLGVYAVVVVRLTLVSVAGVVVAVTGIGPVAALGSHALAAVLIVFTLPTRHKAQLLIQRAEALRGPQEGR